MSQVQAAYQALTDSPVASQGQADVRANRHQPAGKVPWVNRVPVDFTDARKKIVGKDGHERGQLGHRRGWMLLILEGHCRARCYCWVGNDELAREYGCALSTLGDLLREMEDDGYIHRVPTESGRRGRIGIILLERANPDLPTADPGGIDEVIRLMKATKADHQDRRRGQARLLPTEDTREPGDSKPGKPVADDPGKPVASSYRKTGSELRSLSLNEDKSENDAPGTNREGSAFERQRPDPGEKADVPAPSAIDDPETTEAAAGPGSVIELAVDLGPAINTGNPAVLTWPTPLIPAEEATTTGGPQSLVIGLAAMLGTWKNPGPSLPKPPTTPRSQTDSEVIGRFLRDAMTSVENAKAPPKSNVPTQGQVKWLESLTADQRACFDSKSPGVQAKLLEPHRHGLNRDRIIDAEAVRVLSPAAPPAPEIPIPATTAELWEYLPGAPPRWAQLAAEATVRDFGKEKDRNLWRAFLRVSQAVWRGEFPAELVLDAYRQAMKPKSENRGAVFNYALQNNGWQW